MKGSIRRCVIIFAVGIFVGTSMIPISAMDPMGSFDYLVCRNLFVEDENGHTRILITALNDKSVIRMTDKKDEVGIWLTVADDDNIETGITIGNLEKGTNTMINHQYSMINKGGKPRVTLQCVEESDTGRLTLAGKNGQVSTVLGVFEE